MGAKYTGNKKVGEHDFHGKCSPGEKDYSHTFESFSVGIFKIEGKASGKGLKQGKILVRVSGSTDYPERVFDEARRICQALDEGVPIESFKKNTKV